MADDDLDIEAMLEAPYVNGVRLFYVLVVFSYIFQYGTVRSD